MFKFSKNFFKTFVLCLHSLKLLFQIFPTFFWNSTVIFYQNNSKISPYHFRTLCKIISYLCYNFLQISPNIVPRISTKFPQNVSKTFTKCFLIILTSRIQFDVFPYFSWNCNNSKFSYFLRIFSIVVLKIFR